MKKSSSFNPAEKAVRSFICVDHPAALTTQLRWLRWPRLTQICTRWDWLLIKLRFPGGSFRGIFYYPCLQLWLAFIKAPLRYALMSVSISPL
jgi:hypothetical protein